MPTTKCKTKNIPSMITLSASTHFRFNSCNIYSSAMTIISSSTIFPEKSIAPVYKYYITVRNWQTKNCELGSAPYGVVPSSVQGATQNVSKNLPLDQTEFPWRKNWLLPWTGTSQTSYFLFPNLCIYSNI